MIELYDAQRLARRRDRCLQLALAVLVLGLAGLSLRAWSLQRQIVEQQALHQRAAAALAGARTQPAAPTPTLLRELEQSARRLESEVQAAGAAPPAAMRASQWLAVFEGLARPGVALETIDVDREGRAALVGHAATPAALAAYVQGLEQPRTPSLRVRRLEVRSDGKDADLLRFELQGQLSAPAEPKQ